MGWGAKIGARTASRGQSRLDTDFPEGVVVSLLLIVILLFRRLNAPQTEDGHDRGVLDTLSNAYEAAEKTPDAIGFVMLVAVCVVISVGGLRYIGL